MLVLVLPRYLPIKSELQSMRVFAPGQSTDPSSTTNLHQLRPIYPSLKPSRTNNSPTVSKSPRNMASTPFYSSNGARSSPPLRTISAPTAASNDLDVVLHNSSTFSTFPLFSKLAPEIHHLIWRYARPDPQKIKLSVEPAFLLPEDRSGDQRLPWKVTNPMLCIANLMVCQESRAETLRVLGKYAMLRVVGFKVQCFWFNSKIDSIVVVSSTPARTQETIFRPGFYCLDRTFEEGIQQRARAYIKKEEPDVIWPDDLDIECLGLMAYREGKIYETSPPRNRIQIF